MADQVEETMEVIRRDRDTSREFLADVSHELRTPLAALRTFNELLQEKAGDDVAARTEFLEASAQQIERLDWLAQNLLELSKLDSGLIRLDLRPDDLRATILSAVEQAQVSAQRRGLSLTAELPGSAARDPPRPAATRPGADQPDRQRPQVHAPRRVGPSDLSRISTGRPDPGHRHRRRDRRATSCPTSSTASTAARAPTRLAAAAAASGWPSSARSWRCTAAGSWSRAASGSGSTFTVTLPADPRTRPTVIAAVAQGRPGGGPDRRTTTQGGTTGVGSGIVYDVGGWILTNKHVVAGATTIDVRLKDGRDFKGTLYGTTP
jgi:hypothetical protein